MISYVTKWHSRSYVLWSYVSFLLNPEQCICHLWVTKSLTLIFIIGVKCVMCHTELWHASIIIICVTVTRPMEPWSTEQRLIPVSTSFTSSVCNPITWCKTDSSQNQQYPVFTLKALRHRSHLSSVFPMIPATATCPTVYQLDMTWSRFTPVDGGRQVVTTSHHASL